MIMYASGINVVKLRTNSVKLIDRGMASSSPCKLIRVLEILTFSDGSVLIHIENNVSSIASKLIQS